MDKILVSYNCDPYKGSENALGWNWTLAYAEHGDDVAVVTMETNKPSIERYFKEINTVSKNIKFIYISINKKLYDIKGYAGQIIRYRAFQKKAAETVRMLESKYDDIEYVQHITWASCVKPIYSYKCRSDFVLGPVGGGERIDKRIGHKLSLRNKIKEAIRNIAADLSKINPRNLAMYKKARLILTTTEETKRLIPKKYKNKTHIMQAIGLRPEDLFTGRMLNNETGGGGTVLMTGRPLYWKGFDIGIKAIKKSIEANKDIRLIILSNISDDLLLKECGPYLNRNIFIKPFVKRDEMKGIYDSCDIFLNCSLHDSGCLVVLEAMGRGKPVVCIKTGGPAVIANSECGFVVEPTDEAELINRLADGICRLAKDDKLRLEMGKRALKRASEQFLYSHKISRIYDWMNIQRG